MIQTASHLSPDTVGNIQTASPKPGLESSSIFTPVSYLRPMLALEAWAGYVDTQMADMSRARYDDHRLIHDMLVQQAAIQCELQEMRGRVTAIEQERSRREQ
ncbi:hypothetical protein Tco_1417244 [Tanacetum coccineum]